MTRAKLDHAVARGDGADVPDRHTLADAPGGLSPQAVTLVALDRISPNPNQPRKVFDPALLEELAASIHEHGLLQPIVVRPLGGGYGIVTGERRFRAAGLAGLREIAVIVRALTDEQALVAALAENVQRADLSFAEEATALDALRAMGYSDRRIARELGWSLSTVSRKRRVSADTALCHAVTEGRITPSQARELVDAPAERRAELLEAVQGHRQGGGITLPALRGLVRDARRAAGGAANAATGEARATHPAAVTPRPVDESAGERADPLALRKIADIGPSAGDTAVEPSPAGAEPIATVPRLDDARRQARDLWAAVERALPLLAAFPADYQIRGCLYNLRRAIDRALQRPRR